MRRRKELVSDFRGHSDDGEFLWLVSLSDLMILLFVFFVVLFSFSYSKIGASDFRKMTKVLKGESDRNEPLREVRGALAEALSRNGLKENIDVQDQNGALVLQIKEKILFDSGTYEIRPESRQLIGLISRAIEKIPDPFRLGIEGHTDDMPVHAPGILDNWELSVKRAYAVLQALNLKEQVRSRVVLMGYGEMNPIVPNRDEHGNAIPGNQSKNRRVTLRIF